MANYDESESEEEDPGPNIKKINRHLNLYEGYAPIMDDTSEECDESCDPKWIKEILKVYNKGNIYFPLLRDSKRNEYEVVDGKAVMVRKFISWEEGYELCCGDEFVECNEDDC